MITREDLMELEKNIEECRGIQVILAPQDNDKVCTNITTRCKDCGCINKFPILPDDPIVPEKLKCRICGKVDCMCFINIILS